MRPIPFDVPAAKIVFDGLLFLWAAIEVGIRVASARNGGHDRELRSLAVVVVGLGVSVAGSLLVAGRVPATALPREAAWWLYAVGIAVIAFGIAFRAWSVVTLGRYFTVTVQVRADQTVVDRGPYRVLRHPSYTGLLCVCLGMGLALGNWLALLVAVLPALAAIVVRIRVEERTLLATIGEPYRAFCATRKRLVPGVW
jgi:protein-S-isoprenylcysteine O-methyltransferase Ste14